MIDTQLLERFVAGNDPSAFGELVARHGPAVLRTCRCFLHDPHEAEDALQATFLILVRRAPSIRDPERLNRWLVGVARKVAARARRRGVIRVERERLWAEKHPEARVTDTPLLDIRRVVREEMAQLAETARLPLELCYFEGLTHEEAAERLGWPVGTVKVRLVRARRLLRDRLDRRGVALSVAFLLLLMRRTTEAATEVLPVESTARAMGLEASGDSATLRSEFPRAFDMAASRGGAGALAWLKASWIVLLIFLASGGGVALAAHRIGVDARGRAEAANRLLKVLGVDCR